MFEQTNISVSNVKGKYKEECLLNEKICCPNCSGRLLDMRKRLLWKIKLNETEMKGDILIKCNKCGRCVTMLLSLKK